MPPELLTDEALLSELRAIDAFRRRYSSENPAAQVDPQDPDVQRLIEVLAYTAVRTRQAVLRNLTGTWRRLLGTYFQPLLRPLPAMAMVEARVTARMTEGTVLPTGTTLRVACQDGFIASFQTLAELRIVPAILSDCETRRTNAGYRLILTFVSTLPRTESVGLLRMHLNYLDDYLAALSVHHQLKQHAQRAFVVYDQPVHDRSDGAACQLLFGESFDEPYEGDERSPLSAVRSYFHFPQQELLINLVVPPSPRPWSRLSICIELDASWPRTPAIYRELFHPFCVPVQNLYRAPSQPIICDGTQDSYPVRFVHPDDSYKLHSVVGVYRMEEDGLLPIPSSGVSREAPSYELEDSPSVTGSGTTSSLLLRLPSALIHPERILVDGRWHQPSLASHLAGRAQVSLAERSVPGLELSLVGPIRRGIGVGLGASADTLLRLLSLKMKAVLDLQDLKAVLLLLETVEEGPYRGFPQRIRDLVVEVTPDATLRGAGLRHVYHLLIPPVATEEVPLWEAMAGQLQRLLDAWNYVGRSEVVLHSKESELPQRSASPS